MAKRKINKSEMIREFIKANPSVGPTEAAKTLSEQIGAKITPPFVSNIKQKLLKGAGGTARRGRPKSTGRNGMATGKSASGSTAAAIGLIKAAQQFVTAAGGIDSAKEVLDVLEAHFINNG